MPHPIPSGPCLVLGTCCPRGGLGSLTPPARVVEYRPILDFRFQLTHRRQHMVALTTPHDHLDLGPHVQTPAYRDGAVVPPATGQWCYAVLIYSPPRKSRWRPRTLDSIPPLDQGCSTPFNPSYSLSSTLFDVLDFNRRELGRTRPGRPPKCWAVAVTMVWGDPASARPVNLLGGGA